MMDLDQLRAVLGSIDQTLIDALARRTAYRHNAALYPSVPPIESPRVLGEQLALHPDAQAKTSGIRDFYIGTVLPLLCEPGDDEKPRTCLSLDLDCQNALARRLHFATWIARRKQTEGDALPNDGNPDLMEAAITKPEAERAVIERVKQQARTLGLDPDVAERLTSFYADWIIPTSRRIQVSLLTTSPT